MFEPVINLLVLLSVHRALNSSNDQSCGRGEPCRDGLVLKDRGPIQIGEAIERVLETKGITFPG